MVSLGVVVAQSKPDTGPSIRYPAVGPPGRCSFPPWISRSIFASKTESGVPGPVGGRLERQWTVECTADGQCGYTVLIQADDSLCSSAPPPPDTIEARRVRGHTHPAIPDGYTDAETLPAGI
jgi:hypothetical protein